MSDKESPESRAMTVIYEYKKSGLYPGTADMMRGAQIHLSDLIPFIAEGIRKAQEDIRNG